MNTDPISAAQAYRMALQRIRNAQTLHEARATATKALDISFSPPGESMLSINSGYGHKSKQPFVTIGMANPEETANPTIQMRTDVARQIAHQILEAADAAESDGFVLTWLQGTAELSEIQAAGVLQNFREYRDRLRNTGE